MNDTIKRLYRLGQYNDDNRRVGPDYSVVVYINGEESHGYDLLTFEQLKGFLIGVSDHSAGMSMRFVNGGITRKSPMGNTIEPIVESRLKILRTLKRIKIETFVPVAGPAARELH